MKISRPHSKQYESHYAFTAKISLDSKDIEIPEVLWFSLRGDPSYEYPDLSDTFLIGMLPVAMKLGEEIYVEGTVSERLAYGLQTYQSILNCWWPETFNMVEIGYAELVDRQDELRPEGVGCCFSGGVDSFYTVLKHLPEVQPLPGYQLNHALMINGFTQVFDFKGEGTSTRLYEIYRPILENWGVKLLMIDTNIRFFKIPVLSNVEAHNCSNSTLSACVHAIGNQFGRFIIPGVLGHSYNELLPHGFHPALDYHLGTDQLQIIHHAEGKLSRSDKIAFMADNPVIQQYLHVCADKLQFDKVNGEVVNCCVCNKCIRTLITLELLGKIKFFNTFPKRSENAQYKNPNYISGDPIEFILNNLGLARRLKNKKWIRILNKALRIKQKTKPEKREYSIKTFLGSVFNRIKCRR